MDSDFGSDIDDVFFDDSDDELPECTLLSRPDGTQWIAAGGHVATSTFFQLAFDFARASWGAQRSGAWLASFGSDELLAASVWHGWMMFTDQPDGVTTDATVVEAGTEGALPVTAVRCDAA